MFKPHVPKSQVVGENNGTSIQTRSGHFFDLLNPQPHMVFLDDIAEALAKVNRYTGHTTQPLSVAQHCVNCSLMVSPEAAPYALLHDAEEAYAGDWSTPLKTTMQSIGGGAAMTRTTKSIREAVFLRFGLVFPPPKEIWDEVKQADVQALANERRDFMEHERPWKYPMPQPKGLPQKAWAWPIAAEKFKARAKELGLAEINPHKHPQQVDRVAALKG